MKDISAIVNQASVRSKDWADGKLETTLKIISEIPSFSLDWDKGDGEEWARVLDKGLVVAYVAIGIPIIIYLSDYKNKIVSEINDEICFYVEADNFDSPIFRIEKTNIPLIEEVFNCSWSMNVDPEKFSVIEFWWTTV